MSGLMRKLQRPERGFDRIGPISESVAFLDGGMVGVRDSKNPTGPALVFAPGEWEAFTAGVNDGEFDRGR